MCVQDATKNNDALSKEDSALNIEASATSKPKLRLLCNPQRLPKPIAPSAKKQPITTEAKYIIRDYFAWQYMKREKYAREVRWIKK